MFDSSSTTTDDEDEDRHKNIRDGRDVGGGSGEIDTEVEAPAKRRRTESLVKNESTRDDGSAENIVNLIAQASAISGSKDWFEILASEVNLCAQGGLDVALDGDGLMVCVTV